MLRGGPNGTRKREDFDKALEILCLSGRARVKSIGKRRTIKVNPALLDGSAQDDDDAEAPELPARTARAGWNGSRTPGAHTGRRHPDGRTPKPCDTCDSCDGSPSSRPNCRNSRNCRSTSQSRKRGRRWCGRWQCLG